MMYSYGMGLGFLAMLIPMAVFGLIIYWAVYSGVKKAMEKNPPNQ